MSTLVRWEPFRELAQLQGEMGRLFNGLLDGPSRASQGWVPALDVWETENELVYAFDAGPEMSERISFPDAPAVPASKADGFARALRLLHLIAGVSYYKAGVPPQIVVEGEPLDAATAALLEAVYTHGLGEFAYQNQLRLDQWVRTGVANPHDRRPGCARAG